MSEFVTEGIKPILIKAGDKRVLIGSPRMAPKVDCYVVAADLWDKTVREIDQLRAELDKERGRVNKCINLISWYQGSEHWPEGQSELIDDLQEALTDQGEGGEV